VRLFATALALLALVLAGCGDPDTRGAEILRYDIESKFVNRTLPQVAIRPAGAGEGRPLLVFLHGRQHGDDGEEAQLNDEWLAALAALGDDAPAVVMPNGSQSSYWHRRSSGDWAAYVLREVIPEAVRRLRSDPRRIAIGGISMGGWGALRLGLERRFCAVGGHSAAMWANGAETPAGAFDDGADFARNDVLATADRDGAAAWHGAALWLDGGREDPFRDADAMLADALRIPMRVWPGGHEHEYWVAHYSAYLRFYARALKRCRH
jgi:poly(3-hydroxybutyrate) depolymerase